MQYFLRSTFLLLVVLSAILTPSLAQFSPNEPLSFDAKIKRGTLANGLTYYIRQNKKPEQKVELRLVVNAGSILEDDDQQGLAHMAEHMAFNGTKNFKKNDIVSYLQSIGVGFGNDLNAYTSFDETVYMLPIPTDKPGNLEKGFQILEDWAHQVSYLTEDIEGERNVILEESRMGRGADDRMFRKLYPRIFEGSRYANRLPIGMDSIIKNASPDALRRFYKEWYRPNLMAVLVVGDIDPAKAEALIKKHFSALQNPANARPRTYATLPAYQSNQALVVTDKEATNYAVELTYSAFPSKESQTIGEYKADIVQNIFSTLLNMRLRELTQKENPPFLAAGVNFGSMARGYDQFSASAYVGSAADAKKGLAALTLEIERATRYGFTASELERAKKMFSASMERAYNERDKTESSQLVDEYIRNFLTGEPVPGIEKEYNLQTLFIPAITLDEVNAVAKTIAQHPNFVIALTGPDAVAGAELPSTEDLLATANAAAKTELKAYEEKAPLAKLLTRQPKPGRIVKETTDPRLGTKTWTLSNGTTVTLKKTNFKNDQILLGARRAGGSGLYGLDDKYNVQYALSVVNAMGWGDFSPTDLQKTLSGKTAGINAVLSGTSDGFGGQSSVKDLETLLQLLYLKATSPRIDAQLFRSFIQKNKAQLQYAMSDPEIAFGDTLNKLMYGNQPLAPVAVPRPEIFDKISMNRAVEIYRQRFGDMSGMNFVIVGSLDEKILRPLVEKYIGGLPTSGRKAVWKDNGVRRIKGRQQLNFSKGQADKSMILSIYSGELPYSDDLDLKADAISELLNIRIIEELREKIQGIYSGGSSASMSKLPYPNYTFQVFLPCGPEKIDTLLLAMNTEIENLKKNGPRPADLQKVKQQWLEGHKEAMKENGTWLAEILETRFPGDNLDYFLQYEKYVKALTPKGIQEAAQLLLNPQNVITAILRPEAKKAKE